MAQVQFVKFSCDCIGIINLPLQEGEEELPADYEGCSPPPVILMDCRDHEPSARRNYRMGDQSYGPAPPDKVAHLVLSLGKLAQDGERFRTIRAALGIRG